MGYFLYHYLFCITHESNITVTEFYFDMDNLTKCRKGQCRYKENDTLAIWKPLKYVIYTYLIVLTSVGAARN